MIRIRLAMAAALLAPALCVADTTEFCLEGEFDLGARYQGMSQRNEDYPARWCVITEDGSDRVLLSMRGRSNPDMEGSWRVAFIPPDLVRIVNADSPPDIEFRTPKSVGEAQRTRRIDPRRVIEEIGVSKGGRFAGFSARVEDGRLVILRTQAELPLRGTVPVTWRWDWGTSEAPGLTIHVEDDMIFRAVGSWRTLDDEEADAIWQATPGTDPVDVPGEHWPARINMQLVNVTDGTYLVQTVRTGFQHLVVETDAGLVVADAPAGWVELHQIPPQDLVPGLGVSGLSEKFIDFLRAEFPDKPIRAVALTHHHDDHAGGARAFAAAGADIWAPAAVTDFLAAALNRESMPPDRLGKTDGIVRIAPIVDEVVLTDSRNPVRLVNMGQSPHVLGSLGVLAGGYFFQSDLHVPNSDAEEPRADRLKTECWFAEWAVANLPADTVVINSHSQFQTPLSRLERYLESDRC